MTWIEADSGARLLMVLVLLALCVVKGNVKDLYLATIAVEERAKEVAESKIIND
jgi:hypothetical protein